MPKNDFEITNIAKFEEVVHNFGRSDDYMQRWFDAQLDQKILDGIYFKGQKVLYLYNHMIACFWEFK